MNSLRLPDAGKIEATSDPAPFERWSMLTWRCHLACLEIVTLPYRQIRISRFPGRRFPVRRFPIRHGAAYA